MDNNELAFIKDSTIVKISKNPHILFKGDNSSQAMAKEGAESYNSGQLSENSGLFLMAFPIPLIFQVFGIIILLNGKAQKHTGFAKCIDAMNIYNDQHKGIAPYNQKEGNE